MKQVFRFQGSGFRFVLVLVILLVIDQSVHGQAIILKTGQKVDTLGVRREADMVLGKVQVGTGSGEIGYHLAQIAKIEFPEPRGLKSSAELMTQGQPEKALAEIEPVVGFYQAFKEVPGSWWAQAALTKDQSALSTAKSQLASLQLSSQAAVTTAQNAVTSAQNGRDAKLAAAWHALLVQLDMYLAAGQLVPVDPGRWIDAYEKLL